MTIFYGSSAAGIGWVLLLIVLLLAGVGVGSSIAISTIVAIAVMIGWVYSPLPNTNSNDWPNMAGEWGFNLSKETSVPKGRRGQSVDQGR